MATHTSLTQITYATYTKKEKKTTYLSSAILTLQTVTLVEYI